jgi:predicted outer membrane repeat protein
MELNANPAMGTVRLGRLQYELTRTGPEGGAADAGVGDLDVLVGGRSVTIAGPEGSEAVRIMANQIDRVIEVRGNGSLTLTGLVVTEGRPAAGGVPHGGGILVASGARLSVERSSILANSTTSGNGGGIAVLQGTLRLAGNVTVTDNRAVSSGEGGGVYTGSGTTANIADTQFSGNTARNGGGAVFHGSGEITRSDFIGNTAQGDAGGGGFGGGLTAANFTLTDFRVNGNTARRYGGGIFLHGPGLLRDLEISGNTAQEMGGGVATDSTPTIERSLITRNTLGGLSSQGQGGQTTLRAVRIIENTGSGCQTRAQTDGGGNVIPDNSCFP